MKNKEFFKEQYCSSG